ncbi:hypothetical protein Afil01_42930 [Actinorhabdospora filicis]|uniref:Uncharacterized protein n=1 Tax=Actinorhabdospora filicis TaxID=1785913 RepID=A0A9W6SP04_9ACTN|nr:hypothetical protein [Actinorhabdospora filicis]GLZ79486.1 hypothetical protein Afil01_42930 [Actinorhabdospora filicis]
MRIRARALAVLATAATLAGLLHAGTAQAAGTVRTDAEIAELSLAEQNELLEPLRRVADAVDAAGRDTGAAYYAGVVLDANHGAVLAHLTDPSRKGALLAAARRLDKGADFGLLRFERAAYTRARLGAARDRVLAERASLGLDVESIVVAPTGSGLTLRVRDLAAAPAGLRAAPELFGVSVRVEQAAAAGGDTSRRRDTTSWIGGAALSGSGTTAGDGWLCTSGIPARANSDNRSYLITAAHCFGSGQDVWTGWENYGRNRIGYVSGVNDWWDAAAIDTSSTGTTAAWVWEGGQDSTVDRQISGIRYSYQGDWVCHSGFSSGQVCDIHVINQDVTWTGENGKGHRGVEAAKDTPGDAARPGDSGGTVWTTTGSSRQVRGIVSWGGRSLVRWTEATDILGSFGMHIA